MSLKCPVGGDKRLPWPFRRQDACARVSRQADAPVHKYLSRKRARQVVEPVAFIATLVYLVSGTWSIIHP